MFKVHELIYTQFVGLMAKKLHYVLFRSSGLMTILR